MTKSRRQQILNLSNKLNQSILARDRARLRVQRTSGYKPSQDAAAMLLLEEGCKVRKYSKKLRMILCTHPLNH